MNIDFYISVNGNDLSDGSLKNPFRTIKKAQNEVYKAHSNISDKSKKISVFIREGCYVIDKPITMNECNSGFSDENHILYTAYNSEKVCITANIMIDRSAVVRCDNNAIFKNQLKDKIYKIDLKTAIDINGNPLLSDNVLKSRLFNGNVPQFGVYQNERAMTFARFPKVINGDRYNPNSWDTIAKKISDDSFTVTNGDVKSLIDEKNAYAHSPFGYNNVDLILPVKEFTKDGKIMLSEKPSTDITTNQPYYIMNVAAQLTDEGDCYYDIENKCLYLIPFSDTGLNISITSLYYENVIEANNLSFVDFYGIDFEGAHSSIILLNECHNISFKECTFKNSVGHGIVADGTKIVIDHCEITELGMAGIVLSGGNRAKLICSGNTVSNCHIHDYAIYGMNGNAAVTMIGLKSCGHSIIHNKIHHAPQQAVYIGGNENIIAYNEIYDVCRFTSDAGAIYGARDWSFRGNKIHYNKIHDIHPTIPNQPGAGAIAVYLDDCLSGVEVIGNVLYHGTSAAVMSNGGRDNKIENNIMIDFWRGLWSSHTGVSENDTGHFGGINNLEANSWNLLEKLHKSEIEYQREPWASAYPELSCIPDDYYSIRIKNDDGTIAPTHWLYNEGCSFKNNIGWGEWKKGFFVCASNGESLEYYDGIKQNEYQLNKDIVNVTDGNLFVDYKADKLNALDFKTLPWGEIGIL